MSTGARTLGLTLAQLELLTAVGDGDDSAAQRLAESLDAHPIRLSAEVLSTKRVQSGAGVSYGHTFVTGAETTLALVAIGYGHGLPRKSGNRASATWTDPRSGVGCTLPIVGRVAMDVLVLDAGDAPLAPGETVVFFGDPARGEVSLHEWAELVAEQPITVLACLDSRVRRSVTT